MATLRTYPEKEIRNKAKSYKGAVIILSNGAVFNDTPQGQKIAQRYVKKFGLKSYSFKAKTSKK